MGSKRNVVFFYLGAVVWAAVVMAFVVYLFFPYQKALGIALQTVAGGRAAVSMEGVASKMMGIKASKILFRSWQGQTASFELSDVDISWNPLSLLGGKGTIRSKAVLYGGTLQCTMQGIRFLGPSDPVISLKLDHVNLARCPEGAFPWFKGMSGRLDGMIEEKMPVGRPDKETGSFKLTVADGEIKGLQIKNMPQLVVPYKNIVVEGKIDGQKRNISKFTLNSDVVTISGVGALQKGETDDAIDMRLSYRALSKSFPLQGSGALIVSGTQTAPVVSA